MCANICRTVRQGPRLPTWSDDMTERKPANHSKSAPPGPAIKEPGKPPLPKEARKSTQQGGTQKNAAQQSAQGEFGEGNYKATRE